MVFYLFKTSKDLVLLLLTHLKIVRNLGDITLGKGQLGENFFQALTDCQLLKSLVIIDATLGNGIPEIPIHHDRLRQLQIVKCRVLRVTVR